jgi:hypothetical protein
MMILSRKPEAFSEFLGIKEGVDEIEAKKQGDGEADGGFDHETSPLQLGAEARIGRGQREEHEARPDEDEIQHALRSVVGWRFKTRQIERESRA